MGFEGDNMMGVKRNNRGAVLRMLHANGCMSRKRLAEGMHLTPAAITKIVGEMQGEGLLNEGEAIASGNAGRREIMVEINARSGYALGVLINLRQAIVSAADLNGNVLFSKEIHLMPAAPAGPTVHMLSDSILQLASENGIARERIIGLGIAVRGVVSADGRVSVDSYGALAEKNYPICDRFEEYTGLKAVMDNNVRALLAAQMFLSMDESVGSQFFLRCEYGIGSAISVDGSIWNGDTQRCGEIGHIPVVRRGGKLCSCGKRGCLETIASPTSILEDTVAVLSPEITPILWQICQEKATIEPTLEDIFHAAELGDNGVRAIVERATTELSNALRSVVYLMDPGKVVLYGRMFEDAYFLNATLTETKDGLDTSIQPVVIEKSKYNRQLEDKAASLLAVESYFSNGGIQL